MAFLRAGSISYRTTKMTNNEQYAFSNAGGVVGLLCGAPSGPSVVFSRDGAGLVTDALE